MTSSSKRTSAVATEGEGTAPDRTRRFLCSGPAADMLTLLETQLSQCFKGEIPTGAAFEAFTRAVSDAYESATSERIMLQHSLELSGRELKERYQALQKDIRAREMAESERDALFRMSPDMLCIINQRLELLQVNPSWTRLLGYEVCELVGHHLIEWVHPQDRRSTLVEASLLSATGKMTGFENRYRTKSGQWRQLSWTATVDLGRGLYFAVARDVTSQRVMEKELAQSQKLEAVGQLASGMAHEINTPVQFTGDSIQFVSDSFSQVAEYARAAQALCRTGAASTEDLQRLSALEEQVELPYLLDEVPKSLGEAKDGVRRVAELVQALKEYAHPDAAEMAPGDINQALQRTLVLARNELKYVADIETDLGDLPAVPCHIGSLQQVFLNLLVNAAHSIEEKLQKNPVPGSTPRGGIRIATFVERDDVVVTIRDTGCGIPASIRDRIFEPFFTTKPLGKGSGQGLPLVRSVVVEKHHGHIEVSSEPGAGSTFTLRLPLRARAA